MTGRLQVKNGRYYMILNIKDERGCRKAKWVKTGLPVQNNRWRAEKMLRDKLRQYEGLGHISTDNILELANWITNWLEIKKMTLRPNAYQGYKDVVEKHIVPYCRCHKLDLMTVKPANLQDYYSEKVKAGLHPNTLLKHRTIFKGAFDYAYQRQLVFENPMARVIHPKQMDSLVKFFTNDQLRDILCAVRGLPIEPAVYISLFTGFRRGEAVGLRWKSVNFENNTITMEHTVIRCGSELIRQDLGKGPFSIRVISMPFPLRRYFLELRECQKQERYIFSREYENNDYICKRKNGKLLTPDYVTGAFKRFLRDNDFPLYNFHTLRHSSATYLLSQGFQLKEIQGWLGHKKLESTNRYAHLQFDAVVNMAHAFDTLDIK